MLTYVVAKITLLAIFLALIVFTGTFKNVSGSNSCEPKDLSGEVDPNPQAAIFEGKKFLAPLLAFNNVFSKKESDSVLGQSTSEKWIEVDLSEQKLKAWDGDSLFLETLVSSGLPGTPTPKGEFRIWSKARATKMEGGVGKYYYYLPNVPYVMFFENDSVPGYRGFSLHGTYWHNDFGNVHSHGCVNLPTPVAEKLYYWATPLNPEGKGFTRASGENPGTRIIIHE